MKLTTKIKDQADEILTVSCPEEVAQFVTAPIWQRIAVAVLREQGWYSYHIKVSTGDHNILVLVA
jgi:hypothetical protein